MKKKKEFEKEVTDVALRCAKTFVQTVIGSIGTATMFSEINFPMVLSVSLFSTFLCLLMNVYKILNLKVGDEDE